MTCEKCVEAIGPDEPRVDVKEIAADGGGRVKRYHAACAAEVMTVQAVAAPSAPDVATS